MDILNLILATANQSNKSWWHITFTSLITLLALLVSMYASIFKPLIDKNSLNKKTLLMIRFNTLNLVSNLNDYYILFKEIDKANGNPQYVTDYSKEIKSIYGDVSDQWILENNDKKNSLKILGQKIRKLDYFKKNMHLQYGNSTVFSFNPSDDWFEEWANVYKNELTTLLEKHYESLNKKGITSITNKINDVDCLIHDFKDIPKNIYKDLNNFNEHDKKGKCARIEELSVKVDNIRNFCYELQQKNQN
ncbi:hypothetical protein QRX48_02760 [Staphylococcus warneri]